MRARLNILILAVLLAAGAGLPGCHDPRATRATQTRLARIEHYGNEFRDREAEGSDRLKHSSDLIAQQAQREREHFARDLRYLDRWARDDVQRWYDRQPRYRADLVDMFDGNLPLANEIYPRMLY